jgi:hypothetical protein
MGSFESRLSTLAPTPLLGKLQGGSSLLAYTRERLIFLGNDEDRFIERHLIRRVYTPEAGRLGFLDGQGVLLLLVSSSAFQPDALRAFLHAMAANQSYGLEDKPDQQLAPGAEPPTMADPEPTTRDTPPATASLSSGPAWPPVDSDDPPARAEPIISWVKPPQVAQALPPAEPVPTADDLPLEQVVRPSRWMLIYRGLALLVVVLGFLAAINAQTALVAPALQVWILLASLSLGVILWRSKPS